MQGYQLPFGTKRVREQHEPSAGGESANAMQHRFYFFYFFNFLFFIFPFPFWAQGPALHPPRIHSFIFGWDSSSCPAGVADERRIIRDARQQPWSPGSNPRPWDPSGQSASIAGNVVLRELPDLSGYPADM